MPMMLALAGRVGVGGEVGERVGNQVGDEGEVGVRGAGSKGVAVIVGVTVEGEVLLGWGTGTSGPGGWEFKKIKNKNPPRIIIFAPSVARTAGR